MQIELNEQQVILLEYLLEDIVRPMGSHGKTTKAIAEQIISKLENKNGN